MTSLQVATRQRYSICIEVEVQLSRCTMRDANSARLQGLMACQQFSIIPEKKRFIRDHFQHWMSLILIEKELVLVLLVLEEKGQHNGMCKVLLSLLS